MRAVAIIANLFAITSHIYDGSVDVVDAILCAACGFAVGALFMTFAVDRELEKARL